MNRFSLTMRTLLSLPALLLLAACGGTVPASNYGLISDSPLTTNEVFASSDFLPHHVRMASRPSTTGSFDEAANVTESDLSEMRGGFGFPGGFNISFGLTSSTSLDGEIISSLNISAKDLGSITPQNASQMVQVGSNNTINVTTPTTITNNVITFVQNTNNNVTIQNKNQININVSNLAALRNEAALFNNIGSLTRFR